MYPYPPIPAPAPAPAPATSDKTGNRQKGRKGKQGNKTPQKEKTVTLNTTLPRTSLLRPSKLHFYCHHHGWVTTHGWPSGTGGHHGDECMLMKTRPSEFSPAMQAARTPDAVPNHPGSANVQRTNVPPLHLCSPCTLPPSLECPSPFPTIHPNHPLVISAPPTYPIPRFAPSPPTTTRTEDSPPPSPVLRDAFTQLRTTSPLPQTIFPLMKTHSRFASPNPFAALE